MANFLTTFLQTRWRMVVLGGLLPLLCFAVFGMSRLSIESDIDKLFRTPDQALDEFKQRFALSDDDIFIILQSNQDLLHPDVLPVVRDIQTEVARIEGVRDTLSLMSLRSKRRAGRYLLPLLSSSAMTPKRWPATRKAVLNHPLAVDHFLSNDLRVTVITVRLQPEYDEVVRLQALISELERIADEQLRKVHARYDMHRIVTGTPPLHAEIYMMMRQDQRLFIVGGIVLGSLIGWWLFRNLVCVMVVNSGLIGVVVTLGVIGLLGIPITVMNTVIPVIVIIVGFADAVHLMMEIRRRLQIDTMPARAIAMAVERIWLPCFLTSITTAIGFGSLMISSVGAIREFGVLTAFGCVVNFLTVQIVVPILASYWFKSIRFDSTSSDRIAQERFQLTSDRIAALVARRSRWLVLGGCCLTLLSIVLCFSLRSENRLANYLPPGSRALASYAVMQEQFGGAGSVYALLEWDPSLHVTSPAVLKALAEAQEMMSDDPLLAPPISLLDLLHSLPGDSTAAERYRTQFANLKLVPSEHQQVFVNLEFRQAAIGSRVADIGAAALNQVVDKLQSRLDRIEIDGLTFTIIGPTVSMARTFTQLVRDLGWGLVLATCLIFLLMAILFRSIRLGLISAVPNILALAGVGAFLVLTDTPLQMVSVLCFSVCLGISVDDTIHFLLRYLGHRRIGLETRAAALKSVREVGPALFVTTVVFVCGNAVVMLSSIPVLNMYARLSCLSLVLAVVGDLFFLPALVIAFQRLTLRDPANENRKKSII